MLRRTTRLLVPLAAVGLMAALSSCGSDKAASSKSSTSTSPSASTSASGAATMTDGTVDGVTIAGTVGAVPKVTWGDKGVTATDPVRQVLTKGTGDAIATGDRVFVQIWVGNGTTKKIAYSSYANKAQALVLNPTQTLPILTDALKDQAVGSRVLVAESATGAFGDPKGNTSLGLGAKDTAVFVIDVTGKMLTDPQGADKTPAAWAPKVTASGSIPTALDFTGTPKPSGTFQSTTVIEGTGPALKKGDHVYVNYLGQVYDGKKPFDQSYSRGTPFDFDLGGGGVIKGWDQGLVGVKVGSRVLLQIPPSWGYGSKGQPSVGITGTSTLYFVVDVLGAT